MPTPAVTMRMGAALIVAVVSALLALPADARAVGVSGVPADCVIQQRWASGTDADGNPVVLIDLAGCTVPITWSASPPDCQTTVLQKLYWATDPVPYPPYLLADGTFLEQGWTGATFVGGTYPDQTSGMLILQPDLTKASELTIPLVGERLIGTDSIMAIEECGPGPPDGSVTFSAKHAVNYVLRGPGPLTGAQPPGGGGGASGGQAPEQDETHRYSISLKAWIPQQRVADPLLPFGGLRLPLSHPRLNLLSRVLGAKELHVESWFEGDDHRGYGGSSRRVARISFDWDGTRIDKLSGGQSSDPSVRWVKLSRVRRGERLVRPIGKPLASRATSRPGKGVSGGGAGFKINLVAANPLTPPGPTPNINATLTGTVAKDGTLAINLATDRFPSFGLHVERDGHPIYDSATLYNAACNKMTGPNGAARLVIGLNSRAPRQRIVIPPMGTPTRPGLPKCAPIRVTRRQILHVGAQALESGDARLIAKLVRVWVDKARARNRR